MAKAGAHIVGLNCLFDPFILLETMAMMKKALEDQDLHSYLMCQPLGRSYCAEQTPLTHHWSSSVRALWLEMWRLIGSAGYRGGYLHRRQKKDTNKNVGNWKQSWVFYNIATSNTATKPTVFIDLCDILKYERRFD